MKEIILAIFVTCLLVTILTIGALKLKQIQCEFTAEKAQKEYKFSYLNGCYFKIGDIFIPAETWRVIENEKN